MGRGRGGRAQPSLLPLLIAFRAARHIFSFPSKMLPAQVLRMPTGLRGASPWRKCALMPTGQQPLAAPLSLALSCPGFKAACLQHQPEHNSKHDCNMGLNEAVTCAGICTIHASGEVCCRRASPQHAGCLRARAGARYGFLRPVVLLRRNSSSVTPKAAGPTLSSQPKLIWAVARTHPVRPSRRSSSRKRSMNSSSE